MDEQQERRLFEKIQTLEGKQLQKSSFGRKVLTWLIFLSVCLASIYFCGYWELFMQYVIFGTEKAMDTFIQLKATFSQVTAGMK